MKLILIGGEDSYHSEQKLIALKANLSGHYPNLEIDSFYADEIDSINQIPALAGEIGFFARIHLVVLRQLISQGKADLKEAIYERLAQGLDDSSDQTHIILFERDKIDKRSKLYKLAKEKGELFEYFAADEYKVEGFIKDTLWQSGLEINAETKRRLVELLAGQNLQIVSSEIAKIITLAQTSEHKEVKAEYLDVINRERTEDVWELFLLASTDKAKAYSLLDNLLAQQVHHLQIIGYLAVELRKLLQYYYFPQDMKPFIRNKVRPLAQKHSPLKLKILIDKLLNLDVLLKTSNFDPRLGLTLYLSIL